MRRPLQPLLTLADVYGPGRVYVPRAHPRSSRWVLRDAAGLDGFAGNQLCVAGAMPVVCSVGSVGPAAIELLVEAGHAPLGPTHAYRGEREFLDLTRQLAGGRSKLVVQHVHPADALAADAFWVEPRVLSRLNNKARLPEFVPADHVPPRSLTTCAALFAGARPALPVVIKIATDQSTAGGTAVAVCRTAEDFAEAAERFGACGELVLEAYLLIARNPCLHYAVLPDGVTRYLGYAEQDVTPAGKYVGSWIELGSALPQLLVDVGMEVVRRGAAEGYRGIAGIDLAVLDDGRVLVLDLNFRVNGSTAAVLLAPAILSALGPGVMHLRTFGGRGGFDQMVRAARAAVRGGRLLPLSAYDPDVAGHSGFPCRIQGLVPGASRADCLAIEADLAMTGLL